MTDEREHGEVVGMGSAENEIAQLTVENEQLKARLTRLEAAVREYMNTTVSKVVMKWAHDEYGDDYLGDTVNEAQIKRLIKLVDQCFVQPGKRALAEPQKEE